MITDSDTGMKRKNKITLQDIEPKQLFSVPENYFEQLPAAIQERIGGQKEKTIFWLFPWVRYSLTVASLVLVLLCGYIFYFSDRQTNKPDAVLSDLSNQEIVDYLRQSEVTQYEVIETAAKANISLEEAIPQNAEFSNDLLLEEIDPQNLEDYI